VLQWVLQCIVALGPAVLKWVWPCIVAVGIEVCCCSACCSDCCIFSMAVVFCGDLRLCGMGTRCVAVGVAVYCCSG